MTELPTAREALARAVDAARNGDSELADVWTYIASEIRKGTKRRSRLVADADLATALGAPFPGGLTMHDVHGIVCAHGRIAVCRKAGHRFLHTDDGTACHAPEEGTEWQRRITAGDVDPVPLQGRDVPTETRFRAGTPLFDEAPHMEDSLSQAHGEAEATARMDLRDAETTLVQRTSLRAPGYIGTLEDPRPLCVHCAQPVHWEQPWVEDGKVARPGLWTHVRTGMQICEGQTVASEGDEDHRPTPAHTVAWPGEVPYTGIQPESL